MVLPAPQRSESLTERLPAVRGKYRENASLAETTWFRVGGAADVLFKPADVQDLADFLQAKPADVPVTVLGVGSNVIVRDGGIDGVVIRLGRGFTDMTVEGDELVVGAACLDVHVAQFAAEAGRAGLEFLVGIPGTIGGALAMNAGAYGREMVDVLVAAEAVSMDTGELRWFDCDELHYSYRHCGLEGGWVFTRARLKSAAGDTQEILQRMQAISDAREASQPVRSRTGGSTFRNPDGHKAWELIDAAGCRGMMVEGAEVSQKHCNFLINTGTATAQSLETLGEAVRQRVKDHSGIELMWEIKRIGKASD